MGHDHFLNAGDGGEGVMEDVPVHGCFEDRPVASHGGQAVEAFAHVAGLEGDIHLEVAVEAEHGRFS
jgi:hypothetical protein